MLTNLRGWVAALLAVSLVSCGGASGGASAIRFPTRTAPAGYPPPRAEELPGTFAVIPTNDIAQALVGREYRVRYGILHLPDPDQPVDALTGAHGFQAEGPFERQIHVSSEDLYVSVFPTTTPGRPNVPPGHRLVACVDVRPHVTPTATATTGTLIVLDVQPVGDHPPVPLAMDAVTGEPFPVSTASELLDENNTPCDRRVLARMNWDDNLRRLSRRRSP